MTRYHRRMLKPSSVPRVPLGSATSEHRLQGGSALQAAERALRHGLKLAKKGNCFGAVDHLSQGSESLGTARGHLAALSPEKARAATTEAANLRLKLLNQIDGCLRPTAAASLQGPSVWTRIFGHVLTWPRR